MSLSTKRPEKQLTEILPKNSGRNHSGHISVRHQGGRQKRYYRHIDFKRSKSMAAVVTALEYDPNRKSRIALVSYQDGEKSYIIAPHGLVVGDVVTGAADAEVKPGNRLKLGAMPIGTLIHNVELVVGKGGQLVRSAGSAATVLSKEGDFVQVKFPSGEVRRISGNCTAVVGQVGNIEWRHVKLGKAGRARHMGKRPEVRGVAQNPRTHPHGGGEGRSGIGFKSPKSPWGKRTLGKKTRKRNKYSNRLIVSRKKK